MRFTFFLTAAIGLLSPLVAAVAIEPGLTPADVSPALQIDERSAALAKRASGFLATCRSLSLSGSTLRAECRQENNQWRPSTLILGKCLANSCGALVARNNVCAVLTSIELMRESRADGCGVTGAVPEQLQVLLRVVRRVHQVLVRFVRRQLARRQVQPE